MKAACCLFLAVATSHLLYAQSGASSSQPFTNHVAIGRSGISLSLTDELYHFPTNQDAWLYDNVLRAEAQPYWILHNTTSNRYIRGILFPGMSNAFSFKLLNAAGREVPYTAAGRAMNQGPPKTNYLSDFHRIGPGTREFPKLSGLFQIPGAGDYVLELRYWYLNRWTQPNLHFELTEPIRVKVSVRETNASRDQLPSN